MAMENLFKAKMLKPPWVAVATAQEIQKEEVRLGANHEWLREYVIDCLDDETLLQRYAILTKLRLGTAAVHALSYYY